jgi:hypothetical protein
MHVEALTERTNVESDANGGPGRNSSEDFEDENEREVPFRRSLTLVTGAGWVTVSS